MQAYLRLYCWHETKSCSSWRCPYDTYWLTSCADPRGGGSGSTMETRRAIGFLSNTGPDLMKMSKLPSQHSMLGHHRPASETPFRWRFAGGPMKAHFQWYWIGSSQASSAKRKQNIIRIELDPSDKNLSIRA